MPFDTYILDRAVAQRQAAQEQQRQYILAQVQQWLDSQHELKQVYIFGSIVRPGKFKSTSDVDIAIVGELPANFCRLISELAATVGREVDMIELERCHFAHRIREKGVLWTKTA